jgi:hypothetical protein
MALVDNCAILPLSVMLFGHKVEPPITTNLSECWYLHHSYI